MALDSLSSGFIPRVLVYLSLGARPANLEPVN